MAIQHDGKSPGKIWYAWQKTKALTMSFFDYSTKNEAKAAAKNTGFTFGSAIGYGLTNAYLLPLLPIPGIGIIASVAGFYAVAHFGRKAFIKTKSVVKSPFVYNYVRQAEYKWQDKKSRPALGQRIKNAIKAKVDKIPLPLVKAAKWAGLALAVAGAALATGGALNAAGVPAISGSATTATILGGIAKVGAVIGLSSAAAVGTAIGLAVVAIPVGLVLSAVARNAAIRRDPNRISFKPKPPKPPVNDDATPIDKGVVFQPTAQSFEFNDNAPPSNGASAGLSDARKAAAEARAAARKNKSSSNRFN